MHKTSMASIYCGFTIDILRLPSYIAEMKPSDIKPSEAFFREVTVRITENLSPDGALLSTLNYLKKFIPIDTMGFYCFNPEKTALQIVAEVNVSGNTSNINDIVALPMVSQRNGSALHVPA